MVLIERWIDDRAQAGDFDKPQRNALQGWLDERFVAVHATHLADTDFALLGEANATCCLCPTTERDLADGVGPARRLADAGAGLALGTDSNAIVDMFEEARAVELNERLASGERGRHSAAELLRAIQTAVGGTP